jgi:signal transduction histidine kinase
VEELVEDLKETGPLKLAFTCNFKDRLAPSEELDLYRIIQEALHNVIRHAQAELAAVDIQRNGDSLAISVADNGRGFKASQTRTGKVGIGLRTMRNRAAKWGGSFEIQSDQGSTTVHVVIPLRNRA